MYNIFNALVNLEALQWSEDG